MLHAARWIPVVEAAAPRCEAFPFGPVVAAYLGGLFTGPLLDPWLEEHLTPAEPASRTTVLRRPPTH